ncbi:MAG: DUF3656 domain-containing protein, partial [Kiritimatiellota bacterium]|nr:DUF3656 domain-containing protein [Kiritimatiellota bacterium]
YRFEKPKSGLFRIRCPVNFEVHIAPDSIRAAASLVAVAALSPSAEAVAATIEIPGQFHAARNADQMRVAVEQAFGKLGTTRFATAQITVCNPRACFVPVSLLNQVRRQITDQLEARYQAAFKVGITQVKAAIAIVPIASLPTAVASQAVVRWCLKTDQDAWLDAFEDADWQDVDEVVLEVPPDATNAFDALMLRLAERIGSARLRLALPVIVRRWEHSALQKNIRRLIGANWRRWQAANLGAWGSLCAAGAQGPGVELDISADWPMYVLNHVAAEQLLALGATRLTLSPEDDGANLRRLLATLGNKAVVVVYQDTPLMMSEACVLPAVGCDRRGTCRPGAPGFGEPVLTASFGERVRVIARHCRMVVINEKPFCLGPHIPALTSAGARILRADFMYRAYTGEQVRAIWRRLRAGQAIPGTHAGNFERGLR